MEFKTVSLPLDETLQSEEVKLQQEGWQIIGGCKPMVTYALCREPIAPQGMGAFGTLEIDDSKVFVTKAGDPVPS
jgi:hypothetical protein